MSKQGRAVRKQGRSRGKTEAGGGRRGHQAKKNRKGTSRIGGGPGRKGDEPWKYRGGAGKKQGRTGRKQQERKKKLELLTGRTGEGKNQAGNWQQRQNLKRSGKEWETSEEEAWENWRGTSKNWEGPGKNLEGTGKDQRNELHHATNLLNTVWLRLHAAIHLLFHAFRFNARPGYNSHLLSQYSLTAWSSLRDWRICYLGLLNSI